MPLVSCPTAPASGSPFPDARSVPLRPAGTRRVAPRRQPQEGEEPDRKESEDRSGKTSLRGERTDLTSGGTAFAQGGGDLVEHGRQVTTAPPVQAKDAGKKPGVVGAHRRAPRLE